MIVQIAVTVKKYVLHRKHLEQVKKENVMSVLNVTNENFDQTGTIFPDIGEPKYDLLGNRVFFHPPDYDIPRSTYSCCKR